MRYIAMIFWALILGQVVGFLISALNGASYDPASSFIVSVVFAVILLVFPPIMEHFTTAPQATKKSK